MVNEHSDSQQSHAEAASEPRDKALRLLRLALHDPNADFRDGQWEAIAALLERGRLLVVQRTGWGKSSVYFLLTRLLRDKGAGPTLLISPLLALMRNQILSAERIGIRAATINSDNKTEWSEISRRLSNDEVDVLLISPERLSNTEFRRDVLPGIARKVGLLVIDEAHCTSYWGHDFRPDYQRIPRILPDLPIDVPVLATTATANDQVAADIRRQFGNQLSIHRGPLSRASLSLQCIALPDTAAKMAWLSRNVVELRKSGTGIVYVLTRRDAHRIAAWLRSCGVRAEAYTGHPMPLEERNLLEDRLLGNDIDLLVATTALGMGFDKPDLGFVVHFQIPGSVVHYYQHVGRAGRALENAYGVLLSSPEDDAINDFFIENALPSSDTIERLLAAIETDCSKPHSVPLLESVVNLPRGQIDHVLHVLAAQDPPVVEKEAKGWKRTTHTFSADDYRTKEESLRMLRHEEQSEMHRYLGSGVCLMRFLTEALNDQVTGKCGRCAVCRNSPVFECSISDNETLDRALTFIRQHTADLAIEPRRKWPPYKPCPIFSWISGNIPTLEQAEAGRALCVWNDPGWGRQVASDFQRGTFEANLAKALANMIRSWTPSPFPEWMTCIPSSARPGSNESLAGMVASELGIPFFAVVKKVLMVPPQREMSNSWHRVRNRDGVYEVTLPQDEKGPVFVLDDVVETRWTFAVIAALLRRAGSGPVFPVALAFAR